jgi:predicted nucleic acid-binding protein
MILFDTGPLVALFDPKDPDHVWARGILQRIREPLVTTDCVLTETFHLLAPGSRGAAAAREFLSAGGARVWFLDEASLQRCFELMDRYADHMDLADASLVAAAEAHRATSVFTLDRDDFSTYRAVIGRSSRRFCILDS